MAGPGSGHWWGQDTPGHSSSPDRTDSRHDHKSHYTFVQAKVKTARLGHCELVIRPGVFYSAV